MCSCFLGAMYQNCRKENVECAMLWTPSSPLRPLIGGNKEKNSDFFSKWIFEMNVVYFIRTALNLIDDFEKKIKKIYINILRIITNSFKVLTDSSEWSN